MNNETNRELSLFGCCDLDYALAFAKENKLGDVQKDYINLLLYVKERLSISDKD